MAPLVWKEPVSVAFIRPSDRPSVAYIANNSTTQEPSVPKFGRKVPHLRCGSHTSFKVRRSKIRVTTPINSDTHRAPYLTNGKAYGLQNWYTDGGRWPASATGATNFKIKGQGRKVTWSVWAMLARWPINRKRIVVVSPKLAGGYPRTRASLRTSFKVKRSKIKVTSRLTQTQKMCYIFRTVRPKNLKVGMRMEDVDPHQRQAKWPPRLKVKVTRSRGVCNPCGPYYTNFHLVLWHCTKTRMTDNRGDLQGQRSRS